MKLALAASSVRKRPRGQSLHSAADLSPVRGEDEPSGHDLQSESPSWSEYFPAGQIVQLVSSFRPAASLPSGQFSQALASVNGLKLGFAMN